MRKRILIPMAGYYQAVPKGRTVAVVGSAGIPEIAINGGSAARTLGLKRGDPVVVEPAGS
ncbi:MAG: hypothetical protein A3G75_00280 [Verrucomicrobia bacterium RIFCSPLOWO2_12_FULL_64_8]|nr:MAG: hypothetical protein A3G75_00280 [Verrucomicrobia bacterium RIFCSPLOWO2_12_FULL_64_8]